MWTDLSVLVVLQQSTKSVLRCNQVTMLDLLRVVALGKSDFLVDLSDEGLDLVTHMTSIGLSAIKKGIHPSLHY
jgi:hypothetical protein